MVKSRILRATAVALTSVGLLAGFSGIAGASTVTISHTGPYSSNKVLSIFKNELELTNNNHVALMNDNAQSASSGSANVSENTTGGGAKTGSASTSNTTKVTLSLNNSMPAMGGMGGSGGSTTIKDTGPYSENKALYLTKNSVEVTNNNDICIMNSNAQSATSGDANASDNTTAGSVSTGNASTTNYTSFNLSIQN